MRFSVALICALLLGALVIGCGGGGDETITKAAFVAQGNAICKKAMRERIAAERDFFEGQVENGSSPSQAVTEKRYVALVAPHLERVVVEFEGLDDSGADPSVFIASFRDGIKTVENETAEVFEGAVVPFQEASEHAKELGLNACAFF